MSKVADLKKKRAARVDSLAAMLRTDTDETRSLTAEEQTALDQGEAEVRSLDQQIRVAELVAEAERRSEGGEIVTSGGAMDLRRYNLARAIRGAMQGRLDGLEGEYHAEASRDRETRGVMIPTEILFGETRDGQATNDNPKGGFLVDSQLQALADRNRPALKVQSMGATVLNGLRGDIELPNMTGSGTAHWINENQDTTRSEVTFGSVLMGPGTVSGEYRMSRRLILQSNESIENILRRDLGLILATEVDRAAINGDGELKPTGLLNIGIDKVATQTAFSDTVADMIAALEMDDYTGTSAFLTSPKVANLCRKIKDSQGHNISLDELFHQVRREFTTQVPDDIGSGNDKSALIYGIWSELIIAYWSTVDLMVNPYHPDVASNGGVLLHAFLDVDVCPRHRAAFKYAEI